jgi:acetolactate synthase-1/2/3 large subunit
VRVAEAVGRLVGEAGSRHVFGVVGSGNFHVTNALVDGGARFVAARHEGGAATMADAYARMSGELGILTVHQGCGLTNAMTGITEAAKSRTPLLVLAADTAAAAVRSNFRIDQDSLAASVGALPRRVRSPETAVEDVREAVQTAVGERRTVVLNLPLDVQAADLPGELPHPRPPVRPSPLAPSPADAARLVELLSGAARPVFVAGRGAAGARQALEDLAERCGALVATSAVSRGLFTGNPWSLDVSGGFASPLAAELITGADLVVGWGCALNIWTMRHGRLIGPEARVVQVDVEADALGAHRPVDLGVVGDVSETAAAVSVQLSGPLTGYRSPDIAQRLRTSLRWRDVPYDDEGDDETIDPRTLSIGLDDVLPAERVIAVDSGNFMGYPSMFLGVPDGRSFCFTQAFQSVGLGLASAIGAALARPDLLPVAALGDGGCLMGAAELDTVRRLGLPMVVVVYDDEAYGAEVHHFGPDGFPLHTVEFPPTDLAAVGRGHGFDAVTVRGPADLAGVAAWVAGPRDRPLLVDAKVSSAAPAWWLEEAFRGH